MIESKALAAFATATVCAVIASGCGGDDIVDRCVERFNSPANDMRNFVKDSGRDPNLGGPLDSDFRAPVWLGASKVKPDKCVAVVGLGNQGFILLRENFNEGAKPGTWTALSNVTGDEGTPQELADRVREPVALGNPDGTIEAK